MREGVGKVAEEDVPKMSTKLMRLTQKVVRGMGGGWGGVEGGKRDGRWVGRGGRW